MEGRLRLQAGRASAVVDVAAGGRLAALTVDGLSVLVEADPEPEPTAYGWGCYPMAPWAGRLRGNRVVADGRAHPLPVTHQGWALHGTVLDAPWTVLDPEPETPGPPAASVLLQTGLGPTWPWPGEARLGWTLTDDGLASALEVHAHAGGFPASCGWHPWFSRHLERGGPARLDLPTAGLLQRGPDQLPTGSLLAPPPAGPYDDVFATPQRRAELTWPGALRLEITSSCDWTLVFDEMPHAVCVEPQTAPPDGLDPGSPVAAHSPPYVVTPGAPLRATMRWRWQASPDRAHSEHSP